MQDKKVVQKIWVKLTDDEKYIIETLLRFGESMQHLKPDIALEISRLFCLRVYRPNKVCIPYLREGEIAYLMNNVDVILHDGIFYGDLKVIASTYGGLQFFEKWLDQIYEMVPESKDADFYKLPALNKLELQEYGQIINRVHIAPNHPIGDLYKKFLFRLVYDFINDLKPSYLHGGAFGNIMSTDLGNWILIT